MHLWVNIDLAVCKQCIQLYVLRSEAGELGAALQGKAMCIPTSIYGNDLGI